MSPPAAFGALVVGGGVNGLSTAWHLALMGVPRVALATLDVVSYPPDFCPLCQQGIPVEKPGSRPAT